VITFSIDLEDPSETYAPDGRYTLMTRRILDICDDYQRRATFFTVGRVAEAAPRLVQEIAARGHEIAYHSHAHVPLTHEDPVRFAREGREDKDRLEQLSSTPVIGFRAPAFSLTKKTLWALDTLAELGFRYSSSIMPTRISRYGFSDAPRTPFRWPNDIIELPLPVADAGPLRVPYLGGIYLYAQNFALVRRWVARANPQEVLWTYAHPYDFDREEKFLPQLHGSLFASTVLWLARRTAEKKIRKVLSLGNGTTFAETIKPLMTAPYIRL